MVNAKLNKRNLLFSGMMSASAAWGIALYWALVSNGYLSSPWVV